MIEFAKIFYFLFGVFTIVGGVMGYVKAHSWISLIAGGISGALLVVAGYLLPARHQPAFIIALVVSVALAGQFVPKFIAKKAMFPAGVMALLSVVSLVVTLIAWLKR